MFFAMARATTTSDAFNAVAEPRRREILDVLGSAELSVGELVARLGLAQPQVSKHLQVLRQVDLVRSATVGRQRMYRINGPALKPVHDWVAGFERTWIERLDRLERYLSQRQPEQEH
jgi:DNA-binding transcriptional ArsR family regulator